MSLYDRENLTQESVYLSVRTQKGWTDGELESKWEWPTPMLFRLVSTKDTVKVAARFGELSTSLKETRHSPRNLQNTYNAITLYVLFIMDNLWSDTLLQILQVRSVLIVLHYYYIMAVEAPPNNTGFCLFLSGSFSVNVSLWKMLFSFIESHARDELVFFSFFLSPFVHPFNNTNKSETYLKEDYIPGCDKTWHTAASHILWAFPSIYATYPSSCLTSHLKHTSGHPEWP